MVRKRTIQSSEMTLKGHQGPMLSEIYYCNLRMVQISYNVHPWQALTANSNVCELSQGILKGEYHCTVDLLFDWFGLVCFANKNKNCQLSYN